MPPRLTVIWKCINPFCAKRKEETEPLAVDYSTIEHNVALCPRCGEYTLIKMKEVWDVSSEKNERILDPSEEE